jgi:hypothetical protein
MAVIFLSFNYDDDDDGKEHLNVTHCCNSGLTLRGHENDKQFDFDGEVSKQKWQNKWNGHGMWKLTKVAVV